MIFGTAGVSTVANLSLVPYRSRYLEIRIQYDTPGSYHRKTGLLKHNLIHKSVAILTSCQELGSSFFQPYMGMQKHRLGNLCVRDLHHAGINPTTIQGRSVHLSSTAAMSSRFTYAAFSATYHFR